VSEVLYSVGNGIARITINRPEQRNALNAAVLEGMLASVRQAVDQRDVRGITITGAGDSVFCACADLKAFLGREPETEHQHFGLSDFRQLVLDLSHCPKPTVALARGHVMAGGLGIFLACDLSLACDDVHFSTPEIQVGMFPMMVLTLLYRNIGRKKATEMMLLGERISAQEARELGIVNHVYPRAEYDAATSAFGAKVAGKSGAIRRMGKEAIREVENSGLPKALDRIESALGRVMASEDSKEGIRAFIEKRKPHWKNP